MSARQSRDESFRTLRFPRDRSLGQLFAISDRAGKDAQWTFRGNAQGDVTVPRVEDIVLMVQVFALQDLSPLLKLGPSDLYGVKMPPQDQVADVHLAAVGALTSLKVLDLHVCKVTDAGLAVLRNLIALERLVVVSANVTDAGMMHLEKLTNLHLLNLNGTSISDAGLERLKGLTRLQELYLGGTRISDAGIVHLIPLQSLRKLVLATTPALTDAAIPHISRLSALQDLDVKYTGVGVTGRGLGAIEKLESLDLTGTPTSDDCLAQLKGAGRLRTVHLARTAITDGGLVHLSSLSQLTDLNLSETSIGDTGLGHLQHMRSLQRLNLIGTGVTDTGLVHLVNLTGLTNLALPDTVEGGSLTQLSALHELRYVRVSPKVPAEALVELRRQLPNCTIAK